MTTEQAQNLIEELHDVKELLETQLLVNLIKSGLKRDEVRTIMGSLDNNRFSEINNIVKEYKKTHE